MDHREKKQNEVQQLRWQEKLGIMEKDLMQK